MRKLGGFARFKKGRKPLLHLLPPRLNPHLLCQRPQRREPWRLARPPQFQFKPAGRAQPGRPALARRDKRMLQQRHQRNRRCGLGGNLRQQQEHPTRCRFSQRTPGGIVCRDMPAPQMLHHAPRQPAIGGDDSDAFLGLFQGLSHQQCDGLRFFFGIGGFDEANARHAALCGCQFDPGLAGFWRQEQAGNCVRAFGWPLGDACAMPLLHLCSVHAHAIEQ